MSNSLPRLEGNLLTFAGIRPDIPTIRLIGKFHLYLPEHHLQRVYVTGAMSEARWKAIPTQIKLTVLLVFISSGFIIIHYH
jgi:hypothetical protein